MGLVYTLAAVVLFGLWLGQMEAADGVAREAG